MLAHKFEDVFKSMLNFIVPETNDFLKEGLLT